MSILILFVWVDIRHHRFVYSEIQDQTDTTKPIRRLLGKGPFDRKDRNEDAL
jgi:hypothetical protein